MLRAIADAVPVRLMKHDLQFAAERLATVPDERRIPILARQHGMKKAQNSDSLPKLLAAFIHKADESTPGRLLVEIAIFQSSRSERNAATALKEAA